MQHYLRVRLVGSNERKLAQHIIYLSKNVSGPAELGYLKNTATTFKKFMNGPYRNFKGNLLKGIGKKTVRRGGIEPIKRVFTYVLFSVKFGYSEKATKFEKIFHIEFDPTQ